MYSWLVLTWSLTLARLPRAGVNSKPHHYKQNVQKKKDHPKTWVLTGKQFEDFRRKKYTSSLDLTTPRNTWSLNARIVDGLSNQEEINCRKIEKIIQIKIVGILQDEN